MRAQRCGRRGAAAVAVLFVTAAVGDAAAAQAAPPTATIEGPAQAFRGAEVSFTANATDDGTITEQRWDLDDDGAFDDATGPTATTSFSSLGDKPVHLQVTDDEMLQTVADAVVTIVNRPPTVTITAAPSESVRGQTLTFTATGEDPDPGAAAPALDWDTDDDGQFDDAAGASATASYSTLGAKTVRVRATDADGGTATDDAVVTIVNLPPTAAFTFSPALPVAGELVTFTSISEDRDGSPLDERWDFDGDGEYDDAAGHQVSTSFPAGINSIGLQVTDGDGGGFTNRYLLRVLAPAGESATPVPSGTAAGTTAPADTTAPRVAFGVPPGQRLRQVVANGLRLVVRLGEPARVSVRLTVDKRTARRLRLDPRARRPVVVSRLTRTLPTGRTTLRPKFTTKARRVFARTARMPLRITVRATDAAGNPAAQSARLTLKR